MSSFVVILPLCNVIIVARSIAVMYSDEKENG